MNEQTTNEQALPTRITTATVSVTLSHNSNYFKVELGIENESGLSLDEINDYRLKAHDLANEAIEDNRATNNESFQREGNKVYRKFVGGRMVEVEVVEKPIGKKDNTSIESIEKLPLWNEAKKRAVDQKSKNNGKA